MGTTLYGKNCEPFERLSKKGKIKEKRYCEEATYGLT